MIGISLTTIGAIWETAQGQCIISAGEGAGPYPVHDEELAPVMVQVADQECNEGAGVDGPRFDNYKDDRRQAVADKF